MSENSSNNDLTENDLKSVFESMTWIEALEQIWLVQIAQIVPEEIHLTTIDLVNACKGLIETAIAMEGILNKVYLELHKNEDPQHSIALDKSSGFLEREEALLLERVIKGNMLDFFKQPLSSINNQEGG
jgi:hypothetical protein